MRDYAELVKELRCNGMDCGFCMQSMTEGKICVRRKAADAIEELLAKNNELWIQLHVEGRSLISEPPKEVE